MELTINLPDHHYTIWIEKGAIAKVGTWVASLWQNKQILIITDQTVDSLYGEQVEKALVAAHFIVDRYAIPAGEQSKSLAQAEKIYQFLAQKGYSRQDGIIALGGGVVGDLAGFVASTYMRGIDFLQVPTTLLAQVDSSIGGKTAVNTDFAKNLVGTFAQPAGVLIDPETLQTLEKRRVAEGMAEVVKYGAIADRKLWQKLVSLESLADVLEQAEEIILACCKIKAQVVEKDELDQGIRAILNFGHTIGHAVEKVAGYGIVTHGEAVAIGMIQMTKIAEEKGETPSGTTKQLAQLLAKFELPTTYENWQEEALFDALSHDKKVKRDQLTIILLEQIGKAKTKTIPLNEVKDYLKKGVAE